MPDVWDDLVSTKNVIDVADIPKYANLGLLHCGAMHKPLLMIHDEAHYSVDLESTELKMAGHSTAAGAAMMAAQAEAKLKPYQNLAIEKLKEAATNAKYVIMLPPKNTHPLTLDVSYWHFVDHMHSPGDLHSLAGFKRQKTWAQLQREEIEKNARQAILSHMKGATDPVPLPKAVVAHYNPKTYHKPRYTKPDLSVEALTGVLTRFADREVTRMAEQKDTSTQQACQYLESQLACEKDHNRSLRQRLIEAEAETDKIAGELKRLQERDASIARIMSTEGRKFRHEDD